MSGECDKCGEHTLDCTCQENDEYISQPPISTWFKGFDKNRMKRLILDYMDFATTQDDSVLFKVIVHNEIEGISVEDFLNKRYGND